jgi:hypothetical protein
MDPDTSKMLVHHPSRRKHLEESGRDQSDVSEQACSERDCRRVRSIVVKIPALGTEIRNRDLWNIDHEC